MVVCRKVVVKHSINQIQLDVYIEVHFSYHPRSFMKTAVNVVSVLLNNINFHCIFHTCHMYIMILILAHYSRVVSLVARGGCKFCVK